MILLPITEYKSVALVRNRFTGATFIVVIHAIKAINLRCASSVAMGETYACLFEYQTIVKLDLIPVNP